MSTDDTATRETGTGDSAGDPGTGSPRRRRRSPVRLAALGVGVVLVALVGLLAVSKTQTESAESPLLGKVAPPLSGTTIDGDHFDLTDERGRFVVVNFFASWCQPCRDEAPELRRWAERHQAAGDAELVNVLFQDTPESARRFFEEFGGSSWPVLAVDTETIGLDWGVAKVPETFVVNPDGVIVAKTISTVTEGELDEMIARGAALSGPAPTPVAEP